MSVSSVLARQAFQPSLLGIFTNPSYIIRSRLLREIAAAAPKMRGRIMDLGCGSKPYRDLFNSAESYTGVDVAQGGHSHADSKIDVFYDGHHLPFEDQRFDAVVSFEVLEHVFNLQEVLAEVHRVMKPSGVLFVTVPFAWPEHEQPYDYARYTSFGITHEFCQAGFQIECVAKTGGPILALFQLLIAQVWRGLSLLPGVLAKPLKALALPILNIGALTLDRLIPRADDLFCNIVVTARRAEVSTPADEARPARTA